MNIAIPSSSLHNKLHRCLPRNTFLFLTRSHLLGREQTHPRHPSPCQKGNGGHSCTRSFTGLWQCRPPAIGTKTAAGGLQNVPPSPSVLTTKVIQPDFVTCLQRSLHFRSRWSLWIQENEWFFKKPSFKMQSFCELQAYSHILLLKEILWKHSIANMFPFTFS